MSHRIVLALDTDDLVYATNWAYQTENYVGMLKIGLELYLTHGVVGYQVIQKLNKPIVLDLKLKDIPRTVYRTVTSLCYMAPFAITVCADGGSTMIRAAKNAVLDAEGPICTNKPLVLAVTVLTSMANHQIYETGVQGFINEQVLRLARLAIDSGADGLVCSPNEVEMLRREFPQAKIMVPGIRLLGVRPPGDDQGRDHSRTATPSQAISAGADWVVIGRPITEAPDPGMAAKLISEELNAASP